MTDQEDDRTVAINNTGNMVGRELDGRYRILERLGSGGMGTVFKALHLKLGRPVALKILHPHLIVDSKILSRFENEINVMSALAHPNLITIQDAGKTDEGIPYFVMEYLECESLADRLKGGRIEASRALPIFVQIADALQHAHEKGVIHRDLKPANILLIRRNEGSEAAGDFVKVVDLGIAKCLSAGDVSAQKQLTQTGEVFGSPQYMAPEQCLGKPQDARTDVYAFGCVMFEVLCGAPPIVRETALETIFAHVNDMPMSFEDAGLAGEKECDRLERIVMRCLAKAPEDRFASMAEVLTALNDRRSSHSPPPPSRPLSVEVAKPGSKASSSPAPTESRYKPVIILSSLAVVGLLLLVALAGLGLAWTQLQRSPAVPPSPISSTMPAIPTTPNIPTPPFSPGQQTVIEFEKVAGENAAVKVVSEYNGKPTGEFMDLIKGETEVDVGYSEEPVILVVNAYQPTTWTIKRRNPSVHIKKVLAVGYYPQTVRGVPESQVESVYYEFLNADASHSENRTHENPFDYFYFLFGDNPEKDSEFKKMKEALFQHTGCHIRTFKGARSTDRFEVE